MTPTRFGKRLVKRGLQHLAARFGPHRKTPASPQLLILMYHRILPASDPRSRIEEPGMVVQPETLRMHLGILKQYFEMVQLSDWFARKAEGRPLPDRACAITFDDGWADNYEYALPVLREAGVPATLFVVSAMMATTQRFWPERLSLLVQHINQQREDLWPHPALAWLQADGRYRFDGQPPDRARLSAIIAYCKQWTENEIQQKLDAVETLAGIDLSQHQASLLDWEQIREMQQSGLFEIGSHTRHHVRLNTQTDARLFADEIINSRREIEQQLDCEVKTFCYPNGDFCDAALSLVRQHYTLAVTTEAGWCDTSSPAHRLKRIGVHEDIAADRTAFLARVSGWL